MIKKIIGVSVIAVLIGVVAINIMEQSNDTANEYNMTGNTNAEGEYIVSGDLEDIGIQAGNKAPDFELETLSGEQLKLSDLQGKKVILNFWATWCPPCKEEMPEMQEYYDEHQDEVEILAVNLTDSESDVQTVSDYIEEYSYTYPIPLDKEATVSEEYKIFSVPTTYFIDTEGIVQQSRIGPMTYEFMDETVNSLN